MKILMQIILCVYMLKLYYLMENLFIHVLNMLNLQLCIPVLNSFWTNWSCVLNVCSECSSVFFPDTEMTVDEDMELLFILLNKYENISSFYFHKHLIPEHCKTCP